MATNLLIVDDDEEIINDLTRYLKRNKNLHIDGTTSPLEAIEKIKKEKIHVVLLDMVMPEMDGIELLTEIRKIDGLVQILAMSDCPTIENILFCLENGVNDYLIKPFTDLKEVKKLIDLTIQKIERWKKVILKIKEGQED